MRVFISSVRRGLEEERDALLGLIMATGHTPVRFEDFTAQTEPSREACLKGVASSDVYVLILGPNYGYRFPDTGQSPTHDEWAAARSAGLPTYVFRKTGIELEPDQEAFVAKVGNYGSGVFYGEFKDVAELQQKVVKALVEHAAQPSPLVFAPLSEPVSVEWKDAWLASGLQQIGSVGTLELHVIGINAGSIPARMMLGLPERLASGLRTLGAVSMTAGLDTSGDADTAGIRVVESGNRTGVANAALQGVRVASSGQLSLWWSLPHDSMGSILDEGVLVQNLTDGLRTVGGLNLLTGDRFAVAAGLSGSSMISRGTFTGADRRAAHLKMNPKPVQVTFDEAVTAAAFDRGAAEVARPLATMVLNGFDKIW